MTSIKTTQGRRVRHCHVPRRPCTRELNEAEIEEARDLAAEINSNAIEKSPPTAEFNCHGFAYTNGHGWFNHPERFFEDDFDQMSLQSAQRHDVVIYMSDDTLMHSARVTRVANGQIVELESKWGNLAVLIHTLTGVPAIYGQASHIVRRRGVT